MTMAADMHAIEPYRELFPVVGKLAYLNHAALGTPPTPVVEAIDRHISEVSVLGAHPAPEFEEQRERVRRKMAQSAGARAEETAFVKNTPEAIGIVAAGLSWRAGDRVILCDLEFPANVFPWLNIGLNVDFFGAASHKWLCGPTEPAGSSAARR